MKHLLLLLTFYSLSIFAQEKHYRIIATNSLSIHPYKIYKANDGNLLLSNNEINWDVGHSNLLKVKPNGDTIYIRSTGTKNPNILVTSTSNIICNNVSFDPVIMNFDQSSFGMYDKNFNLKWELNITGTQNPSSNIGASKVSSFYEINSNRFVASINTFSYTTLTSLTSISSSIIEFDSLGFILSLFNTPISWPSNTPTYFHTFFGKINSKLISVGRNGSYNSNRIFIYEMNSTNNKYPIKECLVGGVGAYYNISMGVCHNSKIYLAFNDIITQETLIASLDANGIVIWSKVIIPQIASQAGNIKDMMFINNQLVCKYDQNKSSYILNIDTLGQITNSNKINIDTLQFVTNFVSLGNKIYTSKFVRDSISVSKIALLTMDLNGSNNCSSPSFFTTGYYYLSPSFIISDSSLKTPTAFPVINTGISPDTYSITISDSCVSNATSLTHKYQSNNSFVIYPNPSSGIFYLNNGNVDEKNYEIKITNSFGELIQIAELQTNTIINISNFSQGIYYLSVYKDKLLYDRKKIIKIE